MDSNTVMNLAAEALRVALLLSAPALILGLGVGLIISIFQATTQIQEQTLTFVPKIVAILVGMLFLGHWMLNILLDFSQGLLGNLGTFIR